MREIHLIYGVLQKFLTCKKSGALEHKYLRKEIPKEVYNVKRKFTSNG